MVSQNNEGSVVFVSADDVAVGIPFTEADVRRLLVPSHCPPLPPHALPWHGSIGSRYSPAEEDSCVYW
ncbi:hypothetical protein AQI96_13230 [Streptomyces canus]|nr:hypothetical protein AQI96_13230 [Streptomyces canus]